MTGIELSISPLRSGLLAGEGNTVDALVRATAPALAEENLATRKALNLSIVIDRSGSMSGGPLEEAKRCASFIVGQLKATDRLSILAYDDEVEVLVGSTPVVDRAMFHRAISSVHTGGMTALHMGWLKGAEQAAMCHAPRFVSRVLLLSDGNANVGLDNVAEIGEQCANLAEEGITTSTYGLGMHFNEDLMMAMSRAGRGNAYYGETAADLYDPFRQEFELLHYLCARSLRLQLTSPCGGTVEGLNEYVVDDNGRHLLPDLAYDGEAWALARIDLPADVAAHEECDIEVLRARLSHKPVDGDAVSEVGASLRLPPLGRSAFDARPVDELVAQRVQEIGAATLHARARDAARRGDWERVERILEQARNLAGDNGWLVAGIEELAEHARLREREAFSKEALYSSSRMKSRLTACDETMDYAEALEAPKRLYLRRKSKEGRDFARGEH